MAFKEIQRLIKDIVGLDPESIGEAAFERVVRERMRLQNCNNIYSYMSFLKKFPKEQQYLINEITVPETWFFRDEEPFRLLVDYVVRAVASASGRKIKILSMPCSSGEEPYSIVMALFDANISDSDFIVDAADISTKALEHAKRGVYGRNSFRIQNDGYRDKFFLKNSFGMHQICDDIKKSVNFYHQNILSMDSICQRGPYDVIFCRNLLIYFDLETRLKVFKTLYDFLAPEGLLFLGHAETGRMETKNFRPVKYPGAFAYKKNDSVCSDSR